jgi:hypothetical protein
MHQDTKNITLHPRPSIDKGPIMNPVNQNFSKIHAASGARQFVGVNITNNINKG